MRKSLKKRFILVTTLLSFVILLALMVLVNIYNYRSLVKSSGNYLEEIISSEDTLDFQEISPWLKRYENFYVIDYNSRLRDRDNYAEMMNLLRETHVTDTDLDFGSMDNYEQLRNLILDTQGSVDTSQMSGIYGDYRFYKDGTTGKLYLMNIKMNYEYFNDMIWNSIIILFVATGVVFVIAYIISPYAIKPIVESVEKQKKFITNASHELKTPLSIIVSNIELLEYDYRQTQELKNIKLATDRLKYLSEDLLTLAKLNENEKIVRNDFDLSLLANEIVDHYENSLMKKACSLEKRIVEGITISADERDYIKLFTILLDNTVKYAVDNTNIIFKVTKNGKKVIVETVNRAYGLERRRYDEIFERFTRIDKHRNKEIGGNGIGLAIVKSLVEKYKGKVSAFCDGENLIITIEMYV